jgi:exodeoxyribonuclease V alpha subunit
LFTDASDNLKKLYDNGFIDKIGYYNALFVSKFCKENNKVLIQMSSALISYCLDKGHTCVELKDFEGQDLNSFKENENESKVNNILFHFPHIEEWIEKLKNSGVVGLLDNNKPLVIDGKGRLFFQKYYKYEKELAEKILSKAQSIKSFNDITLQRLTKAINLLFENNKNSIDYQKLAAEVALLKDICIISGGAGTGKTYTATLILSLLLVESPSYKTALAAPTGKAANRLLESINIHYSIFKDRLQGMLDKSTPDKCFTIHRLLGASSSKLGFYYNEDRPLPYDILIVDEVSMIDLVLMVHLFRALKKDAKIILLGDKNQLTSVEAGTVLGEICNIGTMNNFSSEMIEKLKIFDSTNLTQYLDTGAYKLQDCMVELVENKRQSDAPEIDRLAQFTNLGKSPKALELIKHSDNNIQFIAYNKLHDKIGVLVEGFYESLIKDKTLDIEKAFERLNKFRILSPFRDGPFSVKFMNKYVENILINKKIIKPFDYWYTGKPILIHKNDYNLNLFNGDVGLCFKDENETFVYFEGKGKIYPSLLPEHETAYAMTVHKAQGSEFDEVLLILGNRMHKELLNKQLLYTAITRAKKQLYICGDEDLIEYAILHPIKRYSALGDHLKTE